MRKLLKDVLTKDILEKEYVHNKRPLSSIARKYKCAPASVSRLMDLYNIPRRNLSEANKLSKRNYHSRNSNMNVNFFKEMSSDLAYILGLWATDGCLKETGHMTLELVDRDVIEWIAETVDYTGRILEVEPNVGKKKYKISFGNWEVYNIFLEYGIKPRKSLSLKFPNIPDKFKRDFIRGAFDGDGSFTATLDKRYGIYRPSAYICSGSKEFIQTMKEEIEKQIPSSNRNIRYSAKKNLYSYAISAEQDFIKFGDWLYEGNAFGIERKKRRFNEMKEMISLRKRVA